MKNSYRFLKNINGGQSDKIRLAINITCFPKLKVEFVFSENCEKLICEKPSFFVFCWNVLYALAIRHMKLQYTCFYTTILRHWKWGMVSYGNDFNKHFNLLFTAFLQSLYLNYKIEQWPETTSSIEHKMSGNEVL